MSWLKSLFPEAFQREFEAGRAWERNRLANDAWWFSHDTPTMELLFYLSRTSCGVQEARTRWHLATGKGRPGIDPERECWARASAARDKEEGA